MNSRKLVFGIVAVFALLVLSGCGDQFGISAAHPLGTFEVMDEILTGKGLEKTERKFREPECFSRERFEKLGKLKVYQYEHFAKTSQFKHWVLIAVDDAGVVRAVGGCFHSGRKSFSDSGSKVEGYLGSLWAEVNGAPGEFEKKNEPGIDVNEFLIGHIEKGNVHGIWKKVPTSGMVSHHRAIHDGILLWID